MSFADKRYSPLIIVLYLVLTSLGSLGNYLHYTIFFDVDYLFGGIAVMLVVYFYGAMWGTVSAFIASSIRL